MHYFMLQYNNIVFTDLIHWYVRRQYDLSVTSYVVTFMLILFCGNGISLLQ